MGIDRILTSYSRHLTLLVWLGVSAFLHLILVVGIDLDPVYLPKQNPGNVKLEVNIQTNQVRLEKEESTLTDSHPRTATTASTKHRMPTSSSVLSMPLRLVTEERYFEARELDSTHLQPSQEIHLDYPKDAQNQGVTGSVRLELFLDKTGEVTSAHALNATPPGVFEQAAVNAFEHQKFEPGLKDGRPVKCRIVIDVAFGEDSKQLLKKPSPE